MADKNNNKSAYEDTFYIIPRRIRKLPGITLAYLDVYESIYQFWNKNLPCFLSTPALQERTGISERQIKEALTYFEKNGELKRERRGLKRYLIQPERALQTTQELSRALERPIEQPLINRAEERLPIGRSAALSKGAQPPIEYKEGNIKNLSKREGESTTPQNTDLALIRKSNPLAAFLPDKYLLMQNTLNKLCLTDQKAFQLFETKFGKLEVTFEEMLYECVMYYALKPEAQNVSNHRFIAWIKREKVEVYDKKPDSVAHKLYRDLTEQEKSLLSDYMHFKKYPDLQHRMTDSQKKQAQDLLDLLKSTQNLRAI